MGINLSGLLGPLVNAGTQAAGTYQQSQAQAGQQQIGALIKAMAEKREQEKEALAQAIGQSTIAKNNATVSHLGAQTAAAANPKPKLAPHSFTVDGQPTMGFADQSGNLFDAQHNPVHGTVTPFVAPEKKLPSEVPGSPEWKDAQKSRVQIENQYGYHPPQEPSGTVLPGANGNPAQLVVTHGPGFGTTKPLPDVEKAGAGGGGANAQVQRARMLAAVSEARLADERMRAYEEKLLSGKASVSPLKQAAGSLTTNLADSHSPFGALMQAGSEFGLNKNDPEYSQYLRDASTIGRAEQMISPRGGNETMVRANALLSRAGTGAMKNTIDASRMARQALFGMSGGLEQAMTPEQSAKVQQGITRIKAGEHGAAAPATREQQLWDAAVKLHGQAKVIQEYGPRPGGDE